MSFHVPYPKMAEKGFRVPSETLLARTPSLDRDHARDWIRSPSPRVSRSGRVERAESEYMRHFYGDLAVSERLPYKVADGLVHAQREREQLLSSEKSCLSMLLETKRGRALISQEKGGSGNYGSGSKQSFELGSSRKDGMRWRRVWPLREAATSKTSSLTEYEALHGSAPLLMGEVVAERKNEFVLIDVTPQGYRHYKFTD